MKSVSFSGIRHKNKCNHLPPLSLSYAHYLGFPKEMPELKFSFHFFLTVLNVCFYLDRILNALLGFSKVFQVLTSCKKVLTLQSDDCKWSLSQAPINFIRSKHKLTKIIHMLLLVKNLSFLVLVTLSYSKKPQFVLSYFVIDE